MNIGFISSNRVHLARQQLLLKELEGVSNVHIFEYEGKSDSIAQTAVDITEAFAEWLEDHPLDLLVARGDRYEILGPVTIAAYRRIKIAHIEGFDLSGMIDNKVRYAISHLSDYHFVTNQESYDRAMEMNFDNVWNFGSLDCEYALSIEERQMSENPYILALWHPVPEEDSNELYAAVESFSDDYEIVGINGNRDSGEESIYTEEFPPEEFINYLRGAACLVGNSSAGLKESSVFGTPTVNVGSRQHNRLRPRNVINAPKCETESIRSIIDFQLYRGKYTPSDLYLQEGTAKNIAEKIAELSNANVS